jgi:RNA polymerase sigma-70 factor (ECF subfamily)
VVSETFLVAWRRLDAVPESPLPWLIGVARHARLNARRGARRQLALVERLGDAGPRAAAEASREEELVHAALARLGERDREILLLSVWDDLDRAAIAEVLGCSQGNVSLRLHRARRRFAASLEALRGTTSLVAPAPISGGADVAL